MPENSAVMIGEHTGDDHEVLEDVWTRASNAAGHVPAALELARDLGPALPTPAQGRTTHLWSALATLGAADLTVARVLEPHLDALAILEQAGMRAEPGVWGVFAAEGPGTGLRASPDGTAYELNGRKHWCSLGGVLDHALVSAWVGEERQLFAVSLQQDGVTPESGTWVARGLAAVDSGPLDFTGATAREVGVPGWYLDRAGFAWGGMGVAAIWFGGAVGVARRLMRNSGTRSPDQVALMHLGAVDANLHAARCVLERAARDLDAGILTGAVGARAALRVRQVVATVCEEVLRRAGHAMGPGPLATDEDHARRVVDLELYLRQWHAERDQAALGQELTATAALGQPW